MFDTEVLTGCLKVHCTLQDYYYNSTLLESCITVILAAAKMQICVCGSGRPTQVML